MPKTTNLGQFYTSGKLYATDPCYKQEHSSSIVPLEVLPGMYNCFITTGQLKDPAFSWDELPGNNRNCEVKIVLSGYDGELNFTQHDRCISVDSGQAGFFNQETYQQDFTKKRNLVNEQYSFFRDEVDQARGHIARYEKALAEKDYNPLFVRMKIRFNDDVKRTIEYFTERKEEKQCELEDNLKILESKNYPEYIPKKYSKKFYEFICDLSMGECHAGCSELGVVSRSGLGDGGYQLAVAKNTDGQIIAAKITFLPEEDLQ